MWGGVLGGLAGDLGESMVCKCHENPDEPNSVGGFDLFAGVPDDVCEALHSQWSIRAFRPGETVIERDRADTDIYFILSGNVHVLLFTDTGRFLSFACLGAGEYFGELSAIDGDPRSATVVARKPCEIASVPAAPFIDIAMAHPEIALRLLKRLAGVVRMGNERILDMSTLSSKQRVCLELLRLSERIPEGGESWHIHPLPTQETIAGGASVTRETVTRVMADLRREGVVRRDARTLYIDCRTDLERYAT